MEQQDGLPTSVGEADLDVACPTWRRTQLIERSLSLHSDPTIADGRPQTGPSAGGTPITAAPGRAKPQARSVRAPSRKRGCGPYDWFLERQSLGRCAVSGEDTDHQAVAALLERLAEAWKAGDATAYAALFTEDADYITFFGLNMPGRRAIEEGHRALFEALRGSRLIDVSDPQIRFVRPDVAIAVVGGGSTPTDPDAPDRESTQTFVLVREADGWRITSFQNTRRAPMPGAPPGGRA